MARPRVARGDWRPGRSDASCGAREPARARPQHAGPRAFQPGALVVWDLRDREALQRVPLSLTLRAERPGQSGPAALRRAPDPAYPASPLIGLAEDAADESEKDADETEPVAELVAHGVGGSATKENVGEIHLLAMRTSCSRSLRRGRFLVAPPRHPVTPHPRASPQAGPRQVLASPRQVLASPLRVL